MKSPTMLVILDGFGVNTQEHGNAVVQAHMPTWHMLRSHHYSTILNAAGDAVGLLPGYIGNSEVGHLTIGAGRIVPSPLKQFQDAIDNKSLFTNSMLISKFKALAQTGKSLHLIGLLSDAGVHSHQEHLYALLKLAQQCTLNRVFIHAILDGRDVAPTSAATYLQALENVCTNQGLGVIASVHGRFYAMDRDNNWDRTLQTYDVLCTARPKIKSLSWQEALKQSYHNALTDEFVKPTLLLADGSLEPGDGILFFNFRPDRARQLTEAFINPLFSHFTNRCNTANQSVSFFITPLRYKEGFKAWNNDVIFQQHVITNTLLDVIAQQTSPPAPVFIIAETEKYAHVTYFFRGMREINMPHETTVLIPSLKAKNYVAHPEMSAPIITRTIIQSLRTKPAFFYVVNYANADMVGHSGNLAATIKACTIIDQQLALLYYEIVKRQQGTLIITADHGNAEQKIDAQGKPSTAHTTNPVPFVYATEQPLVTKNTPEKNLIKPIFGLSHIAPTVLKQMKLKIPQEMEQETIF